MKVFWAWQSDTPGKIGRHFIRAALEAAIAELKSETALEESERDGLHLDHDRKGVPGSPDLARTIFEKIDESSVFVGDVTLTGSVNTENLGGDSEPKRLINSNVAIELGYALKQLGDSRVLMVFNEHYGDREGLPFDLRHKAGPITFNLALESSKEERDKAQRELMGVLKKAITACQPSPIQEKHEEIQPRSTPAHYFDEEEVLTERAVEADSSGVSYRERPIVYLRVVPTRRVPELTLAEVREVVCGINLRPLVSPIGGGASWDMNRYGGITYSHLPSPGNALLCTSSQLFKNREIWGVDATLLRGERQFLSAPQLEKTVRAAVYHYLEVAAQRLGISGPVFVEFGVVGISNFHLHIGGTAWADTHRIIDEEIRIRTRINSFEQFDVDVALLEIFEKIFDAAALTRPEGFEGFPVTEEN